MKPGSGITRVLAAAIFMIAAWLSPSLANAHAGHTEHAARPFVTAPVQSGSAQQKEEISKDAVSPSELRASFHAAKADTSVAGNCDNCCCGTASGSTCCGAALANDVSVPLPTLIAKAFRFADAPDLPSNRPEGLRKPPRNLA